ncbi:MAG: BlaI/MecI/CopY family transcriptional regulator [Erysipelotrichaceae bacterium]
MSKISASEYRFCLILWEHEPIEASKLTRICEERLGWKRTTTYTVIKRLCENNVIVNNNGTVTSLVSREEAESEEIDEMLSEKFEGSIPRFLTAFTRKQSLNEKEIDEIQKMIDTIRKGGNDGKSNA